MDIFDDITTVNNFLIPNREEKRRRLKQLIEKKLKKINSKKVINLSEHRDDCFFLCNIKSIGILKRKNSPSLKETASIKAILHLMAIIVGKSEAKRKEYHAAYKLIKAMWEYNLALARVMRTGEYGVCMGCSKEMSPGKLARNPIAKFCYKCEKALKV